MTVPSGRKVAARPNVSALTYPMPSPFGYARSQPSKRCPIPDKGAPKVLEYLTIDDLGVLVLNHNLKSSNYPQAISEDLLLSNAETRIDGSWLVESSNRLDWPVSDVLRVSHEQTLTMLKVYPLDHPQSLCPPPIVRLPTPYNKTLTSEFRSEHVETAPVFNDDSSDVSDEYAPNATSSSDEIGQDQISYIYRFVCKKCGDHRHQSDDCDGGDIQNRLDMQQGIVGAVEAYYQSKGYRHNAGWWSNVIISRTDKRLDVGWHCRFCGGGFTYPVGPCTTTKATMGRHRKLAKLLMNRGCRESAIERWVRKLQKCFLGYLKQHHPHWLIWHEDSPSMPEAAVEEFNNKFRQTETLARLEEEVFAALSKCMGQSTIKYAERCYLEALNGKNE